MFVIKHRVAVTTCAAAILAAAAVASSGAAATSFPDAPGDSGSAPDVTTIDVSHSAAGDISFQIGLGNRGSLGHDEYVVMFLDTDANPDVGPGPMGSEYVLLLGAVRFVRLARIVSESEFDFNTPQTTLSASLGPPLNATINRRELGDSQRFNFGLVAAGEGYEDRDWAPERGMFSYSLAPPTVRSLTPKWAPGQPRAGKPFALAGVDVALSTGTAAKASSYECRAKLAGKAIRATGKCRWLLPRTAKGKTLAVTITAASGPAAKTSTYQFRVR